MSPRHPITGLEVSVPELVLPNLADPTLPVGPPPAGPSPDGKDGGALAVGGATRLDLFYMLLQQRIVYLGQQVDDEISNYVTAQFLYLEAQDPDADIWLYINSPGGSVTAGMAIYDTMQFVQPDVATICLGLAASMGQFLLCAGAPGKRYALTHARIMMHQPLGGVRGQAADIAIQAEQMAYTKKILQDRIAHHTGQPYEKIVEDSERDRWFTADQAKEYGQIDHVVTRRNEFQHLLGRRS